jgi:hypothetical protein
MNDEHVLAFIEAVDRADLDAVHILALDAILGDDIGHLIGPGASPALRGMVVGDPAEGRKALRIKALGRSGTVTGFMIAA